MSPDGNAECRLQSVCRLASKPVCRCRCNGLRRRARCPRATPKCKLGTKEENPKINQEIII